MKKLRGILPPIATPFEDGEIAPRRLRSNLEKLKGTALSGFLVLGSTGEAPLLREDEKLKLVEAARAAVSDGSILMVGAGCESTAETIRFVNRVTGLGADCALVITPSFYASSMTAEVLYNHYLKVAEGAKTKVLIYIVPQFTGGVVVDSDTVARLAEHPNIVGLKDSSGHMGRFAEYVKNTPGDFAVFAGDATTLHAALALGAAGGILAVANLLPEACVRMMEIFEAGDLEKARRIQMGMIPIIEAVTKKYGIPGLKAAMDLRGYYGGDPRSPLLPVNEQVRARLGQLLQEAQGALAR